MQSIRFIRTLAFAFVMLALSAAAQAQIAVSINIAPPALPVYQQPVCPAAGYIWTPGYWAYSPDGYYWVPGTWVEAPAVGMLWTPGYWAFGNGGYVWNAGYWGPQVGFYGGIVYGFGYTGVGYQGGYWNNGQFYYNRSVNNVSTTNITNVYNKTVVNNTTVNRVSYKGGPGGTIARPTAQQEAAARGKHMPPTAVQARQQEAAKANRAQLASVNHGHPPVAATSRAGEFAGTGVMAAKGATTENKTSANKPSPARTKENKTAVNKAAATRANENRA